MRKGFDGLTALVIEQVEQDPQSGHLFVFFNKRANLMKAIVWEDSGFWILYKRLEHGRFKAFDKAGGHGGAYEMRASDLALLLDGIDLRGAKRRLSHDTIHARD